jgi:hypothetical protein
VAAATARIDPQICKSGIRIMIEVCCRPTIEPHAHGWELVLWTGEPFDYSTPFGKMLAGIAGVLSQDAPSSIELPVCEDHEDFVEGTLQFGDETIRTYCEHSLSYLILMSDSANTPRKIADRLATYSDRVAATARRPKLRISGNHGQGQWCPGKDSNLHGR